MKNVLATLGTAALLACGSANASILFNFTPSSQHVNIGDIVTVDATISGLGTEILSAFDLNFFWNQTVMGGSFRSADATSAVGQLGGNYGAAPIFAFDVINAGEWGLQSSAIETDAVVAANQDDSFLLAQFTFRADADGVTNFTLGLDPDFERNFVGLNFASLDVQVGSACIAVGTGQCMTVSEPATFGLAGLALVGTLLPGALRRRRKFGN
jgi:hypothetical protein